MGDVLSGKSCGMLAIIAKERLLFWPLPTFEKPWDDPRAELFLGARDATLSKTS